jgi:hypothetical protein
MKQSQHIPITTVAAVKRELGITGSTITSSSKT